MASTLQYHLAVIVLLATPGIAQRLSKAKPADSAQERLAPVSACPSNPLGDSLQQVDMEYFDENNFQLEAVSEKEKETEMDEFEDMAMEDSTVLEEDMPTQMIKQNNAFQTALSRSLRGKTQLAELNPYVAYSESQYMVSYRCCPRSQRYGCITQILNQGLVWVWHNQWVRSISI